MKAYRLMASSFALAAVFACLVVTGSANAASSVLLTWGVDSYTDSKVIVDEDGDGVISGSFMYGNNGDLISGNFFTVDDPIINIAVSAIDGGAASSFFVSAMLLTDIPGATYTYDLTGSGGYTGGVPANGVGLSPIGTNPGVFLGYKDDVLVASAGDAQFTPNSGTLPVSGVYGPVSNSGATLVCAAGCTSDTLTVAWTGTGQGDSYGLTAQFINKPAPVPVPAALPLMLSAVSALGIIGLRRNS